MHRKDGLRHLRPEVCARLLLQQVPGRVHRPGVQSGQQDPVAAQPQPALPAAGAPSCVNPLPIYDLDLELT